MVGLAPPPDQRARHRHQENHHQDHARRVDGRRRERRCRRDQTQSERREDAVQEHVRHNLLGEAIRQEVVGPHAAHGIAEASGDREVRRGQKKRRAGADENPVAAPVPAPPQVAEVDEARQQHGQDEHRPQTEIGEARQAERRAGQERVANSTIHPVDAHQRQHEQPSGHDVDAILDGRQHEQRAGQRYHHRHPAPPALDARIAHPEVDQPENGDPERHLRPAHEEDGLHPRRSDQRRHRREQKPLQRRVMLPEVAIRHQAAGDPVGGAIELDLVPVERMQSGQRNQAGQNADQDESGGKADAVAHSSGV